MAIDDDIAVPRKHVVIDWSEEDKCFVARVSKNSNTFDGAKIKDGSNSSSEHDMKDSDVAEEQTLKKLSVKRPHPRPTSNESTRNCDEDDVDDDELEDSAIGENVDSHSHLPIKAQYENGETYQTMIEAAFASGEMEIDGDDNSVLQPVLVDWITHKYFHRLDEPQKQSLRKGVYNMLMKHYERVDTFDGHGRKRPQRGTIRWRPKK